MRERNRKAILHSSAYMTDQGIIRGILNLDITKTLSGGNTNITIKFLCHLIKYKAATDIDF